MISLMSKNIFEVLETLNFVEVLLLFWPLECDTTIKIYKSRECGVVAHESHMYQ